MSKDVFGNVMEGVVEIKVLFDKFNEILVKFVEFLDDDEMNVVIVE